MAETSLKYRCLVLDHDDTAVRSTAELHYPAFRVIMESLRPEHEEVDLRTFILKNFEPGIVSYYVDELGFSEEELKREHEIWREYIKDMTPTFYDGFLDIIRQFQKLGGYVCVASHSIDSEILRHYKENDIKIDMIFGRELPNEQQKPNAYPILQIMKTFDLEASEILVLDDMKFGYDMARRAGTDFAAAGWSYDGVPQIEQFMRRYADFYFEDVKEFGDFIFEKN